MNLPTNDRLVEHAELCAMCTPERDHNGVLCFGHKMRPMGPLSGRTICARCWNYQEGEDTPHDRKEHFLWKGRVAALMREHGFDTDLDEDEDTD